MNRRGFLEWMGIGAATAAASAIPLTLTAAAVEHAPPARIVDIAPGKTYFAVLMNYRGQAVRTMMVEGCPTEIHIQHDGATCEFRLASKDRYDGRTIEGLARYIAYRGAVPASWGTVKLGF